MALSNCSVICNLLLILTSFLLQSNLISAHSLNYSILPYKTIETNRDLFFEQLRKYRDNNILCDFLLVVENTNYCVHKVVLMSSSKYFEAMFSTDNEENHLLELNLENVSKTHFQLILDFMYGKPFDFSECPLNDLVAVHQLADQWFLQSFNDECKEFVTNWAQNGKIEKCYQIATELKMDNELRKIIVSVSQYFFTDTINIKSTEKRLVNIENLPVQLFSDAISLVKVDLEFLTEFCKWLISQTSQNFEKYVNNISPHFQLVSLKTIDLNQFFANLLTSSPSDSQRVLRLQIILQETLSRNRKNILDSLKLQIVATAVGSNKKNNKNSNSRDDNYYNNTVLKLNFYDPTTNGWLDITYFSLLKIYETFLDEDQLYMLNQKIDSEITYPCQYAIFDLRNKKPWELLSEFPCIGGRTLNSLFLNQKKIYYLERFTDNGSSYAGIAISNTVTKSFDSHIVYTATITGYGSLSMKNGIVYFISGKEIHKYNRDLKLKSRINTPTVAGSLKDYPKSHPKLRMISDTEIIAVDNSHIFYNNFESKNQAMVKHDWNRDFVHLTDEGMFVVQTISTSDDEMKFSFYDYKHLIDNKTLEETVLTYVSKPPIANEENLKYFLVKK